MATTLQTEYPRFDELVARVRRADPMLREIAVIGHAGRLCGEAETFVGPYLAELAKPAGVRQDGAARVVRFDAGAGEDLDALRGDAMARRVQAEMKFRADSEEAWRRPIGMRADGQFGTDLSGITVTAQGALRAPGRLAGPPTVNANAGAHPLHSTPVPEPTDEKTRAQEHLRRLENLWRNPTVGVTAATTI